MKAYDFIKREEIVNAVTAGKTVDLSENFGVTFMYDESPVFHGEWYEYNTLTGKWTGRVFNENGILIGNVTR